MILGAILPHVKLYGGVRRFFELGNAFIEKGHNFNIYTPDGYPPDWIVSKIKVKSFTELFKESNDILFFTDRKLKDVVLKANSGFKVFYHVSRRIKVREIIKDKRFQIFACSQNVWKHDKFWFGISPYKVIGGVNTISYFEKKQSQKKPGEPVYIMTYGRICEKIKGADLIVSACEKLYKKYPNIRLILFDSPQNKEMEEAISAFTSKVPFEFIINHPVEKNTELFHKADIFVSAEKQTGWANTVAEAMASGIPVIATKSGTLDMIVDNKTGIFVKRNVRSIYKAIEKLVLSPELRNELAKNGRKHIEKYDWKLLAENITEWYSRQINSSPSR
jgi:glycosyltransferase involved in cell wall biosynthesis